MRSVHLQSRARQHSNSTRRDTPFYVQRALFCVPFRMETLTLSLTVKKKARGYHPICTSKQVPSSLFLVEEAIAQRSSLVNISPQTALNCFVGTAVTSFKRLLRGFKKYSILTANSTEFPIDYPLNAAFTPRSARIGERYIPVDINGISQYVRTTASTPLKPKI